MCGVVRPVVEAGGERVILAVIIEPLRQVDVEVGNAVAAAQHERPLTVERAISESRARTEVGFLRVHLILRQPGLLGGNELYAVALVRIDERRISCSQGIVVGQAIAEDDRVLGR